MHIYFQVTKRDIPQPKQQPSRMFPQCPCWKPWLELHWTFALNDRKWSHDSDRPETSTVSVKTTFVKRPSIKILTLGCFFMLALFRRTSFNHILRSIFQSSLHTVVCCCNLKQHITNYVFKRKYAYVCWLSAFSNSTTKSRTRHARGPAHAGIDIDLKPYHVCRDTNPCPSRQHWWHILAWNRRFDLPSLGERG